MRPSRSGVDGSVLNMRADCGAAVTGSEGIVKLTKSSSIDPVWCEKTAEASESPRQRGNGRVSRPATMVCRTPTVYQMKSPRVCRGGDGDDTGNNGHVKLPSASSRGIMGTSALTWGLCFLANAGALFLGTAERRCCTNRHWPARGPPTGSSLSDAIRHWSAEGGHPIEDLTAKDSLTPCPAGLQARRPSPMMNL